MAVWTDLEDAAIRANARTHSASQIAAMLPGRTRASVIGRAWRLGASLTKDETTRLELEHPKRRVRRNAPPVLPADPVEAWPHASPAARRTAMAVQPRLLRLEALPASQCRWPYGEEDVRFCGHVAEEGVPYCSAHRGLAYVPDASSYDAEALAALIDRRERRTAPTAV